MYRRFKSRLLASVVLTALLACGGAPTSEPDAGSVEPQMFTLTVDNHGGGVVRTPSPHWPGGSEEFDVIQCGHPVFRLVSPANGGLVCRATVEAGTELVLTAYPDQATEFLGWQGACDGTNEVCTVVLDQDLRVSANFTPGQHRWSARYGTGGAFEAVSTIATDASGNIYVMGDFGGTLDLGGETFVPTPSKNMVDVYVDVYLAKYSSAGEHLWSTSFQGPRNESVTGFAVDAAGNVVVGGNFRTSVDVGGGLLELPKDPLRDEAFFLAKFSTDGEHLWSFHSVGSRAQYLFDLAIDQNNDIVITGLFGGNLQFGVQTLDSANGAGIVAKYSADGSPVWIRNTGNGVSLTTDSQNNIILTRDFVGTFTSFGQNLPGYAEPGRSDIAVSKLSPTGDHIWSRTFGSAMTDRTTQVLATEDDSVLLVSSLSPAPAYLGGLQLPAIGTRDLGLSLYSSDGVHVWSYRYGGHQITEASAHRAPGTGAVLDADGNLLVTGYFSSDTSFNGKWMASLGEFDAYLTKFGPDGIPLWARRYGDTGSDYGVDVAMLPGGDIILAGTVVTSSFPPDDVIHFGGENLEAISEHDLFLVRVSP